MTLIDSLKWRYATKKFDASKKITNEQLATLKEAIQLSASSYGLQLYKVLLVENPAIRKELQPVSWGQTQIVDASHLLVFCNITHVTDEMIDQHLVSKADSLKIDAENLKGYGDFMKSKIVGMPQDVLFNWTAKQTYIALGNLMAACGELNIDSCPIEGFEPEKYNEILGLTEKGLSAAVVAAVGYRSEEDQTQYAPKFRKSETELFEVV